MIKTGTKKDLAPQIALSVGDHEEKMRLLKQENFDLRLYIYHLEENIRGISKSENDQTSQNKLYKQYSKLQGDHDENIHLMKQANNAIETLKTENELLRQEISSIPIIDKEALAELIKERDQYSKDLKKLKELLDLERIKNKDFIDTKQELQKLKEELKQFQNRNKCLEDELAKKNIEIACLKKELKNAYKQLKFAKEQAQQAKEQLELAKKQLHLVMEQLEKAREQLEQAKEMILNLKGELDEALALLKLTKEQLKFTKDQLKMTEDQLNIAMQNLNENEAALANLKALLDSKIKELERLSQELDKKNADLDRLKEIMNDLNRQIQKLRDEIEAMEEERRLFQLQQKRVAQSPSEMEIIIEGKARNVEIGVETQEDFHCIRVNELESELSKANFELKQLRQRQQHPSHLAGKFKQDMTNEQLRAQLRDRDTINNRLAERLADAGREIANLRNKNDKNDADTGMQKLLRQKDLVNEHLADKLAESQIDLENLQREYNELKFQANRANEMEALLDQKTLMYNKLYDELSQIKKFNTEQDDGRHRKSELEQMKEKLDLANEEIASLQQRGNSQPIEMSISHSKKAASSSTSSTHVVDIEYIREEDFYNKHGYEKVSQITDTMFPTQKSSDNDKFITREVNIQFIKNEQEVEPYHVQNRSPEAGSEKFNNYQHSSVAHSLPVSASISDTRHTGLHQDMGRTSSEMERDFIKESQRTSQIQKKSPTNKVQQIEIKTQFTRSKIPKRPKVVHKAVTTSIKESQRRINRQSSGSQTKEKVLKMLKETPTMINVVYKSQSVSDQDKHKRHTSMRSYEGTSPKSIVTGILKREVPTKASFQEIPGAASSEVHRRNSKTQERGKSPLAIWAEKMTNVSTENVIKNTQRNQVMKIRDTSADGARQTTIDADVNVYRRSSVNEEDGRRYETFERQIISNAGGLVKYTSTSLSTSDECRGICATDANIKSSNETEKSFTDSTGLKFDYTIDIEHTKQSTCSPNSNTLSIKLTKSPKHNRQHLQDCPASTSSYKIDMEKMEEISNKHSRDIGGNTAPNRHFSEKGKDSNRGYSTKLKSSGSRHSEGNVILHSTRLVKASSAEHIQSKSPINSCLDTSYQSVSEGNSVDFRRYVTTSFPRSNLSATVTFDTATCDRSGIHRRSRSNPQKRSKNIFIEIGRNKHNTNSDDGTTEVDDEESSLFNIVNQTNVSNVHDDLPDGSNQKHIQNNDHFLSKHVGSLIKVGPPPLVNRLKEPESREISAQPDFCRISDLEAEMGVLQEKYKKSTFAIQGFVGKLINKERVIAQLEYEINHLKGCGLSVDRIFNSEDHEKDIQSLNKTITELTKYLREEEQRCETLEKSVINLRDKLENSSHHSNRKNQQIDESIKRLHDLYTCFSKLKCFEVTKKRPIRNEKGDVDAMCGTAEVEVVSEDAYSRCHTNLDVLTDQFQEIYEAAVRCERGQLNDTKMCNTNGDKQALVTNEIKLEKLTALEVRVKSLVDSLNQKDNMLKVAHYDMTEITKNRETLQSLMRRFIVLFKKIIKVLWGEDVDIDKVMEDFKLTFQTFQKECNLENITISREIDFLSRNLKRYASKESVPKHNHPNKTVQIKDLEATISSLRDEVKHNQEKRYMLKSQNNKLEQTINQFKEERQTKNNEEEIRDCQIMNLTAKLALLQDQILAKEHEIVQRSQNDLKVDTNLSKEHLVESDLQDKINSLKHDTECINDELKYTKGLLESKCKECKEMTDAHRVQISDMCRCLDQVNDDLTDERDHCQQLLITIMERGQESRELRQIIIQKETLIEELKVQIEAVQASSSRIKVSSASITEAKDAHSNVHQTRSHDHDAKLINEDNSLIRSSVMITKSKVSIRRPISYEKLEYFHNLSVNISSNESLVKKEMELLKHVSELQTKLTSVQAEKECLSLQLTNIDGMIQKLITNYFTIFSHSSGIVSSIAATESRLTLSDDITDVVIHENSTHNSIYIIKLIKRNINKLETILIRQDMIIQNNTQHRSIPCDQYTSKHSVSTDLYQSELDISVDTWSNEKKKQLHSLTAELFIQLNNIQQIQATFVETLENSIRRLFEESERTQQITSSSCTRRGDNDAINNLPITMENVSLNSVYNSQSPLLAGDTTIANDQTALDVIKSKVEEVKSAYIKLFEVGSAVCQQLNNNMIDGGAPTTAMTGKYSLTAQGSFSGDNTVDDNTDDEASDNDILRSVRSRSASQFYLVSSGRFLRDKLIKIQWALNRAAGTVNQEKQSAPHQIGGDSMNDSKTDDLIRLAASHLADVLDANQRLWNKSPDMSRNPAKPIHWRGRRASIGSVMFQSNHNSDDERGHNNVTVQVKKSQAFELNLTPVVSKILEAKKIQFLAEQQVAGMRAQLADIEEENRLLRQQPPDHSELDLKRGNQQFVQKLTLPGETKPLMIDGSTSTLITDNVLQARQNMRGLMASAIQVRNGVLLKSMTIRELEGLCIKNEEGMPYDQESEVGSASSPNMQIILHGERIRAKCCLLASDIKESVQTIEKMEVKMASHAIEMARERKEVGKLLENFVTCRRMLTEVSYKVEKAAFGTINVRLDEVSDALAVTEKELEELVTSAANLEGDIFEWKSQLTTKNVSIQELSNSVLLGFGCNDNTVQDVIDVKEVSIDIKKYKDIDICYQSMMKNVRLILKDEKYLKKLFEGLKVKVRNFQKSLIQKKMQYCDISKVITVKAYAIDIALLKHDVSKSKTSGKSKLSSLELTAPMCHTECPPIECRNCNAQVKDLQLNNDVLSKQMESLRIDKETAYQHVTMLKQKIDTLTDTNQRLVTNSKSIEVELDTIRSHLFSTKKFLHEENMSLKKELNDTGAELDTLYGRVEQTSSNGSVGVKQTQANSIMTKQQKISKLNTFLLSRESYLMSLEGKNAALKDKVNTLQKDLCELKACKIKRIATSQRLKECNRELTMNICSLKDNLAMFEVKGKELTVIIAEKEATMHSFERIFNDYETQIETFRGEMSQKTKMINGLRQELDQLHDTQQNYKHTTITEHQRIQRELARCEETVAILRNNNSDQERSLATINQELQTAKDNNIALEAELQKKTDSIININTKYSGELENLLVDIAAKSEQVNTMQHELETRMQENALLNDKLYRAQDDLRQENTIKRTQVELRSRLQMNHMQQLSKTMRREARLEETITDLTDRLHEQKQAFEDLKDVLSASTCRTKQHDSEKKRHQTPASEKKKWFELVVEGSCQPGSPTDEQNYRTGELDATPTYNVNDSTDEQNYQTREVDATQASNVNDSSIDSTVEEPASGKLHCGGCRCLTTFLVEMIKAQQQPAKVDLSQTSQMQVSSNPDVFQGEAGDVGGESVKCDQDKDLSLLFGRIEASFDENNSLKRFLIDRLKNCDLESWPK